MSKKRFGLFRRKRDTAGDFSVETKSGDSFSVPFAIAEEMRLLIARQDISDPSGRVIAVCSTVSGEGTTFIARALAATIAHDTQLTACLVDCNWEAPTAAADDGSLAGILRGDDTVDEAAEPTNLDRLHMIASGELPLTDRAPSANSAEMTNFVDEAAADYDVVILDVPPLTASAYALTLAGLAQECLLVVRQGGVPIERVQQAMNDLGRDRVSGVVLNDTKISSPAWLISPLVAG